MIPTTTCIWCRGVTGHAMSCQCTIPCGAYRCPVDEDPAKYYGYLDIPVPVFTHPKESTDVQ